MSDLSRRQFTTAVARVTLAVSPIAAATRPANAAASNSAQEFAVPERLQSHIRHLFGAQRLIADAVSLNLPALAENGNSVALGIALDSSRTPAPVRQLFVFSEKNPLPDVARFSFTADAPMQELALRIRLSDSQQIIAVAQTEDNRLYAGSASIIVTLAACIDIPQ